MARSFFTLGFGAFITAMLISSPALAERNSQKTQFTKIENDLSDVAHALSSGRRIVKTQKVASQPARGLASAGSTVSKEKK